jgi:hypothetical protein
MKNFFIKSKKLAIAGFFFLLPVFVIFVIISKAFTALTSVGTKIAGVFGLKTIVGIGSVTIYTSLLLIIICMLCGMLAIKFSFMRKFSKMIERRLEEYIPGYDTYRVMAEEKLQQKGKILPYTPALLKTDNDLLQPVFIIEQDDAGNNTILIPGIPETNKGQIFIVKNERLKRISAVSANDFDASLRTMGTGLLSKHQLLL